MYAMYSPSRPGTGSTREHLALGGGLTPTTPGARTPTPPRAARDRRPGLHSRNARLGRDPERGQHVGVLGRVIGIVVAHLGIGHHARVPAALFGSHVPSHRVVTRAAIIPSELFSV